MSIRDTFWIGLIAVLCACTEVELTSLGVEGDLCFQDAECETGLVCKAKLCTALVTPDVTEADADTGSGDVPISEEIIDEALRLSTQTIIARTWAVQDEDKAKE